MSLTISRRSRLEAKYLRLMDDCLKIVTIVTRGNDVKLLLQLLYELRHNLKQISYEANISNLKDGGIGILMRANR